MHAGSINNPDTAAGRVYRILQDLRGGWIGGWELTQAARTTAVSTRVSEIRSQLTDEQEIQVEQRGRYFYYRLVRTDGAGQQDLMSFMTCAEECGKSA